MSDDIMNRREFAAEYLENDIRGSERPNIMPRLIFHGNTTSVDVVDHAISFPVKAIRGPVKLDPGGR